MQDKAEEAREKNKRGTSYVCEGHGKKKREITRGRAKGTRVAFMEREVKGVFQQV